MKYLCTDCTYEYDEIQGDESEGIEPCTPFEDLSEDEFSCPGCHAGKDMFEAFEEENHFLDIENPSSLEKEYLPSFTLQNDMLNVYIKNPMIASNFIYSLGIYYDDGECIEKEYMSIGDIPSAKFSLEYIDEFELRIETSHDGIWSTGIIEKYDLE